MLMKWAASHAAWSVSELELPRVDPAADPALQRLCAVAGGLGLILSRLQSTERSARFPHTEALYALIRRRLRHSEPVRAGADLLGEVMHEIADSADPLTRGCLKACFGRRGGRGRRRSPWPAVPKSPPRGLAPRAASPSARTATPPTPASTPTRCWSARTHCAARSPRRGTTCRRNASRRLSCGAGFPTSAGQSAPAGRR
jgi:hypothetical protein